ncbi:MAG: hypothetical protein K6E92_10205 [Lachnospiraceae bacterium]|nr:hypothetical protein [Lachnospiraceae bacterium]
MKRKAVRRQFTYLPMLYLSEELNPKNLPSMRRKLEHAKPGLVAILLTPDPKDQLELVRSFYLRLNAYEGKSPKLVGIAKDQDDAALLVEKMTQDCLRERGDCDLRAYCESLFGNRS